MLCYRLFGGITTNSVLTLLLSTASKPWAKVGVSPLWNVAAVFL